MNQLVKEHLEEEQLTFSVSFSKGLRGSAYRITLMFERITNLEKCT